MEHIHRKFEEKFSYRNYLQGGMQSTTKETPQVVVLEIASLYNKLVLSSSPHTNISFSITLFFCVFSTSSECDLPICILVGLYRNSYVQTLFLSRF